MNLIEGALRFSTGNAAKNSYLITTPTAALGVRGTIFTIEATRAKTLVTLNEGAMDVCMRCENRYDEHRYEGRYDEDRDAEDRYAEDRERQRAFGQH